MIRALTIFAGLLAALFIAHAADTVLPPYFVLPPGVVLGNGQDSLYVETWGEAEFYEPADRDTAIVKKGRHWRAGLAIQGVADDTPGKALWEGIKPAILAQGWDVSIEYDSNPFSVMLRYTKDGKDAWAYAEIFGRDDIRMDIVEVGDPVFTLVAPPPAAKPEKLTDDADFPYIPRLAGSEPPSTSREDGPMTVDLPGSEEKQLVGTAYIIKNYLEPPGLSTILFVAEYHHALEASGWTIISESAGPSQTDATLTAHYDKNGRNIWAYLHDGGGNYGIQVADIGNEADLAKQLKEDCHVALYGVLFDFNKATLKAESDPVLKTVLDLLNNDAALKLEVQGHTDAVGSDEYNQTLSENRARSVVAWLTDHGVAADRLTYKGYGKTVPVATNDTDEGRAKNRRVEIARQDCVSK